MCAGVYDVITSVFLVTTEQSEKILSVKVQTCGDVAQWYECPLMYGGSERNETGCKQEQVSHSGKH